MSVTGNWQFRAIAAAVFAAATAIFAKLGIENIDSEHATFIHTLIVAAMLALILAAMAGWQSPATIPAGPRFFLGLSGAAAGLSWIAYFKAVELGDAARVVPLDKLSIVLATIFGVISLGRKLDAANWLGVAPILTGVLFFGRTGLAKT